MAGFLRGLGGTFGTQQVVIIHNEGTEDETRTEAQAHIQARQGFFEVETRIYEGDIVEMDDPRGGRERRLAAEVLVHNVPGGMAHTSVVWGKAGPPRGAPVRRLRLENLHRNVIAAASDLFNDQHYASAVSEAFKSIEVGVRDLTKISDKSGPKLMAAAFAGQPPSLDVSTETGRSGDDEREVSWRCFAAPCSVSAIPRRTNCSRKKTRTRRLNTWDSLVCCTAVSTRPRPS